MIALGSSPTRREMAKWLKEARIKAGLTVVDVSKRVGVSRQAIYRWEDGLSVPLSKTWIRLCALYETAVPQQTQPLITR